MWCAWEACFILKRKKRDQWKRWLLKRCQSCIGKVLWGNKLLWLSIVSSITKTLKQSCPILVDEGYTINNNRNNNNNDDYYYIEKAKIIYCCCCYCCCCCLSIAFTNDMGAQNKVITIWRSTRVNFYLIKIGYFDRSLHKESSQCN